MKTLLRLLCLPLALIVLASAYYIKMPDVRKTVDARVPWVGDLLGRFVQEPKIVVIGAPAPKPEEEPEPTSAKATPRAEVAGPKIVLSTPTPAPSPRRIFDLKDLAGRRSDWPAKLMLTKATAFPAVTQGKVIGSLTAPSGSEVKLMTISGGRIGVEFQGGGAWVLAEDTDIVRRTMPN
jgi:hypothetical protein